MNQSLEQKIRDHIQKSGYPTEIISSSIMQQRGWTVIHSPSYWDDSERKSREFDILANRDIIVQQLTVRIFLISECKKSDNPWAFFMTPKIHSELKPEELIKTKTSTGTFSPEKQLVEGLMDIKIYGERLLGFHHYFQNKNLARNFCEPLKINQDKPNRPQMIYSAIMSSIKATLFHCRGFSVQNALEIYYQVIIFNGNLFEVYIDNNREVSLHQSDHIYLNFNYTFNDRLENKSIRESQNNFIIDIIQESYLDNFLKGIEDEQAIISQLFLF